MNDIVYPMKVHAVKRAHRTRDIAFVVPLYIIVYQLLYFDNGHGSVSWRYLNKKPPRIIPGG